jgi:uncharacterized RDD family membrane protein YckC
MVSTATPGLSAAARTPYAGLATRGLALAIDAGLANLIVLVVGALIGLVASLIGGELRPQWLAALLAAAGWAFAVGTYFTVFWSTTGQTPGMRLMALRVLAADGEPPHLARSIVRLVGLGLAIIPLFAGFIPVLFDERRRGVHDLLARTVVVHAVD